MMTAMFTSRAVVSMTLLTPVPNGCRSLAIPWEANGPQP